MKQKILVETIERIWTEAEVDLPVEAFKDLNDWIEKNPELVKQATLRLKEPLATSTVGLYYTREDVAAINYMEHAKMLEDVDEFVSEDLHDIASAFCNEHGIKAEEGKEDEFNELYMLMVQKIFDAFYFHMAADKLPSAYKEGGGKSL